MRSWRRGAIYPDAIETASSKTGKAHVIKSYHNFGGLPEEMVPRIRSPRGPGLGVCILRDVTQAVTGTLREADRIFRGAAEGGVV